MVQTDYEKIAAIAPELEQFSFTEFAAMRMLVNSRVFGIEIDGIRTDGFVPYADMLNHRRPA
jgi:histone-lysine N-methyltransferase SETD3